MIMAEQEKGGNKKGNTKHLICMIIVVTSIIRKIILSK